MRKSFRITGHFETSPQNDRYNNLVIYSIYTCIRTNALELPVYTYDMSHLKWHTLYYEVTATMCVDVTLHAANLIVEVGLIFDLIF